MNVPPEPPARPDGFGQPPEAAAHKRRPWGWIVACGFLVVIAAGFAIWALNLDSDLDHQKNETAAAQQQNDEIAQQVDDISNEVDQAGENAQGILADIKAKLTALVEKIKQAAGGGSSGSGNTGSADSGSTATAAQSGSQVSAATPLTANGGAR